VADLTEKTYPRQFVPVNGDMGDWNQIEPLFDALEDRTIDSAADLEQWLLDGSELAACISQESSRRYTQMTCATDNPEKEKAYLDFVENIAPKCKPRWHRLNQKYVASPAREQLPQPRYQVYDRSTRAAVELFRDENVPLQTEDDRLAQHYQKLCGAMSVQYEGKEQTLQQMSRYQQEPNRETREQTWKLVTDRRLQDRSEMDELFDKMIANRTQIAKNADFDSFRDYQFEAYERFDYTPQDCFDFHAAIEQTAVPLKREIQRRRKEEMDVDALRPWDLSVDPKGRDPLRPFEQVDDLTRKCSTVFHRVDPVLGQQFDAMVQAGWLDLDSRKGKAPGGYQASFDEERRPFIFMNAVGLHRDVETLLHEGGHAFHSMACRDEPLVAYRHCGMEMAEVASMGMELLAYEHLDVFYSGDDLERARREQLEGIIGVFPWIATIDAFQHWLYTNPDHTVDQRTEYWLSLLDRFGGMEDYSGLEPARQAMWQRQLHLYQVPFYYIEYGIAQIGALQLWQNARADREQALRQYRSALALGGSRPLPELWAAAGLKFDFKRDTLEPLVNAVNDELNRL
jgi:oligoendopeptidase F